MSGVFVRKDKSKQVALLIGLVGVPLALIAVFGHLIVLALYPPQFENLTVQLGEYHSPVNSYLTGKNVVADLWADLGRDNKLISWRNGKDEYRVYIKGVEIGSHWQLPAAPQNQVRWHIRADTQADISIIPKNPQQNSLKDAEAIGLYVCDDRWQYRATRVQSGELDQFVGEMYPGKWIYFPIEEINPHFDDVRLTIKPLIGYGSLISAIAVIRRSP